MSLSTSGDIETIDKFFFWAAATSFRPEQARDPSGGTAELQYATTVPLDSLIYRFGCWPWR